MSDRTDSASEEVIEEDIIICARPHGSDERPALEVPEDMEPEEAAYEADWLETDEGWLCPDAVHDADTINIYEVSPGVDGDESAMCTSADTVAEVVGWMLAELPESGPADVTVHIKRTEAKVGDVRAAMKDPDSEGEE